MMNPRKDTKMDHKKMTVIDELVEKGVFKIEGKQLYEASLYELLKETMQQTK